MFKKKKTCTLLRVRVFQEREKELCSKMNALVIANLVVTKHAALDVYKYHTTHVWVLRRLSFSFNLNAIGHAHRLSPSLLVALLPVSVAPPSSIPLPAAFLSPPSPLLLHFSSPELYCAIPVVTVSASNPYKNLLPLESPLQKDRMDKGPGVLLPCLCYPVSAALFSQLCVQPRKNAKHVKTPSRTH